MVGCGSISCACAAAPQVKRLSRCSGGSVSGSIGCAGATAPQVRRCLCRRESAPTQDPLVNEHKNPDFVLETPENGGPEGQKSTKTSILCSKCPKTEVPDPKSAQKPRFCAREVGKLASGSATVAFLQITAHASKMQIPHNQIINFYQRAR